MSEYKISLGIDFDGSGELQKVKNQINSLTDNTHRVRIDIDNSRLLKQIKHAKSELKALNNISGNNKTAISIDTSYLKKSLNEVSSTIKEIKNSMGTIDSGSGMKSLLSSINQISSALEKASGQFESLNAELKTLSSKDFNVNIGVKMGSSSSVDRKISYGTKVRDEVIPELEKQIKAFEDYFAKRFKGKYREGSSPLSSILTGSNVWEKNKTNIIDIKQQMADSSNLEKQIKAYRKYISIIKEAAELKGFDVSEITSQFSKSADKLVQDAIDVRDGTKEVEQSFEKLKQVFGGGNNFNIEGISTQLDSIVADLGEIRAAIQSLSSGTSLDGLTASFDRLSETLEKLLANLTSVQSTLNNGFAGAGAGIGDNTNAVNNIEKASDSSTAAVIQNERKKQEAYKETAETVESANRQAQKIISDAAQKSIDDVSSEGINKYFKIDKDDSKSFEREMSNLVSQWTDGKGRLKDVKIDTRTTWDKDAERNIERLHQAHITYNNGLDETINKTIAWRKIGAEFDAEGKENPIYGFAEVSSKYSKSIIDTTTKTNSFVKQQKNTVSNLTNQINQLNRAAIDQNASRPIKESVHLDALSSKYNEIISAIQRLKSASSDTFVDEQNNVKALIAEYKSLVSEYKNAENVSTKMRGSDFQSGLDIARNDLEKFKAEARDFPQINATIEKLSQNLSTVGDASSLNEFNDQLRVARSELAKIKTEISAANRNEKVGINVSGLESQINELRKISPEIDAFETEINGAKVTVQSLLDDLNRINTQGDFSVINSKFKAFANAAKAAGISVESLVQTQERVKNIKLKLGDDGEFATQIQKIKSDINKFSEVPDGLRQKINELENAWNSMNLANEKGDIQGMINAWKDYETALDSVINQLKQAKIAQKDFNDAQKKDVASQKLQDRVKLFQAEIDAWLRKNSAAADRFGDEMLRLKSAAESVDKVQLDHLISEFKRLDREAEAAGLKTLSLGDKIKTKFKEYSTYFGVAEVFMWVEQGLRDMFQQVVAIDSAMTELKKVTDESDASYNQFLVNAASRASEIGTTIDGLVSSTADFARLGYSFESSQGLAEVANIYAVVGDEIDSVETATQSLISTFAAFKNEAAGMSDSDFAMDIIDKFNEVSNNFAISSGGIGEALQRSASSLYAANNSLDESIALITAANTVVQDPDVVGTALKTVSMRVRGAKTEMEEAGLETDGMAESTAKLRAELLALSGVDIMLDKNTFKSTYQIMEEIASKWESLTDIQQASVTELIAGRFYQYVQKCA